MAYGQLEGRKGPEHVGRTIRFSPRRPWRMRGPVFPVVVRHIEEDQPK